MFECNDTDQSKLINDASFCMGLFTKQIILIGSCEFQA